MESQTAEGAFDGFFPQSPSAPQGTASGSEAPDTEYRYLLEEESDIFDTEEYSVVEEHGFTSVSSQPFSTFAADVDTASYANWRRMVNQYMLLDEIPDGAIRTEEFLNYFDYGYDGPEGSDLFGVNVTIGDCPWNPDTKLLVMGLQTTELAYNQVSSGNNLVFLIDVSGSMDSPDKLGLLKESFSYLVENLNPSDTVSIVTYSGTERVVLDGEPAENKRRILRAVDRLEAGGSTNGQAGLAMAYEIAREHFIEGGNNRIVLASDGDLNVGMTSESELSDYVSEQRKSGIYLSVLGFGDGNYKDSKMETIANDGNGNYHYIDCLAEAEKVLGRDLCATMVTVADDVKLQLEFNPAYVKGYRQIGYENRELSADEFRDDSVDAGEVGTGHSVTVAYELVMTDSAMELFAFDSRYSQASAGVQNG
ncbi:MAG: von Willebrand factor type A domain-containing protein, partial [Eggerthellaceae bacterium]|nr:von Willebrand factor type A domain-containing protein [Eggerthellaceae bacterium]